MTIKCCHNCAFRHKDCHDKCKTYLEEKARYEAAKHIFREKNPTVVLEYISDKFNKARPNGYKTRKR